MVIPTRYYFSIEANKEHPAWHEDGGGELYRGYLREHRLTCNLSQENAMSKNSGSPKPMTQTDASRIQSAEARANGGKVASGSFAARAQGTAARNETPKK
jgi:hypothetical protein